MKRHGRLRLGVFSYLEGPGTPAENFADVNDMFTLADSLGIDVAWVAHHHFAAIGGLPSPFVYFGSLAARTERIGLGTAVVQLPTEHPLRVAEDAAVLETLHPGRLQLGVGTGFATPSVLAAFGHPDADKRALYDDGVERLYASLRGEPLTPEGATLYPDPGCLSTRIWEAPGSPQRVIEAARRGSGLLLSRIAIGVFDRSTADVQRELVDAYYSALPEGVPPRIGLSRTVYVSADPEAAYASLAEGLRQGVKPRNGVPSPYAERSTGELFELYNVHWGTPEAVAASLRNEPLIDEVTDLICQLSPATPTQEQSLEAIRLLAQEVGPAIGWEPAAG